MFTSIDVNCIFVYERNNLENIPKTHKKEKKMWMNEKSENSLEVNKYDFLIIIAVIQHCSALCDFIRMSIVVFWETASCFVYTVHRDWGLKGVSLKIRTIEF